MNVTDDKKKKNIESKLSSSSIYVDKNEKVSLARECVGHISSPVQFEKLR